VSTCRCHYPGGIVGSDRSWDGLFHPFPFFANDGGLPRLTGGSAPTLNLSRPAQHSLALRPVDSQHRRAVHLSRRLRRLCYLRRRSDSFRPERPSWPGGTCTRWEDAALSRRTANYLLNVVLDECGRVGDVLDKCDREPPHAPPPRPRPCPSDRHVTSDASRERNVTPNIGHAGTGRMASTPRPEAQPARPPAPRADRRTAAGPDEDAGGIRKCR